jgi:hypothetical protein
MAYVSLVIFFNTEKEIDVAADVLDKELGK